MSSMITDCLLNTTTNIEMDLKQGKPNLKDFNL